MNYQVMYCSPITALKTTKALQRIIIEVQREYMAAKKEANKISRSSLSAPYRPSDDEVDEISESSMGDLRHATVQLQLLCVYRSHSNEKNRSLKSTHQQNAISAAAELRRRDSSFSSLRGVGKLLSAQMDSMGRLNKDVDSVMERSEFPLDMSLAFMQFHSIESLHRTSVAAVDAAGAADAEIALLEDIGLALDCYAEAGMFWDKQYVANSNLLEHGGSSSGSVDNMVSTYPVCYSVSIASRAVGVARGPERRSWLKSVAAQTWDALLPPSADRLVDLTVDEDNLAAEWEETDLQEVLVKSSRQRSETTGSRKKMRVMANPDLNVSNRKTGGFVKLTRPKVLDLW